MVQGGASIAVGRVDVAAPLDEFCHQLLIVAPCRLSKPRPINFGATVEFLEEVQRLLLTDAGGVYDSAVCEIGSDQSVEPAILGVGVVRL